MLLLLLLLFMFISFLQIFLIVCNYHMCKMFVVFEFLIWDIFLCDKAIHILVSRYLAVFCVSMTKSFIYCFIGISIIKS